jgi:hypothetical protein
VGQKTHPYGFRLGYNKSWKSRWFAKRDYADLLHEDVALRKQLKEKLRSAGVSGIDIERAANKLVIRIYTARPGIIIGRKGSEIDKLKQEVQKRTKREVHIVDCAATRKARGLPAGHEEVGGFGAAIRMQGNQGSRGGAPERRGNRAQRVVPARAIAAADAARRH